MTLPELLYLIIHGGKCIKARNLAATQKFLRQRQKYRNLRFVLGRLYLNNGIRHQMVCKCCSQDLDNAHISRQYLDLRKACTWEMRAV